MDAWEFPGGLAVMDSTLFLLWLRFHPWPGKFCMLQAWQKKKKKNNGCLVDSVTGFKIITTVNVKIMA